MCVPSCVATRSFLYVFVGVWMCAYGNLLFFYGLCKKKKLIQQQKIREALKETRKETLKGFPSFVCLRTRMHPRLHRRRLPDLRVLPAET